MVTFINQLSIKRVLFISALFSNFICYCQYGAEFDTYKAKWPEAKKIHLQDHIVIFVKLIIQNFQIKQ